MIKWLETKLHPHMLCVINWPTVYPKKYAHGFVVLCFVVVMQSFIMNSHEVFTHIHQGCFAGTGAIIRLPQCQWSKPGGYGKISQCITTTKQKPCAYFLGYTVIKSTSNLLLPCNLICLYVRPKAPLKSNGVANYAMVNFYSNQGINRHDIMTAFFKWLWYLQCTSLSL